MAIPSRSKVAGKRVAVYARRSDERGDRERSVEEQIAECERAAKARGHVVTCIVRELGSGVTGEDRPEFMRLIREAESKPRPFDVILCLDVSRFGRFDVNARGYWLHRLALAGVRVEFVLDNEALSGPAGGIIGAVFQHGAHEHSVKTAYKVALGQAKALEDGRWPGGSVPFGIALDEDGHPRPVEALAAGIRRAFELRACGAGPARIASILNADGVPGPGLQGQWTRENTRTLLGNPIYIGDIVRLRVRRGRGRRRLAKFYSGSEHGPVAAERASEEGGATKRDALEAIVPRELWERVQRVNVPVSERPEPLGGVPRLFSNLARCGECGGPVRVVGGATMAGKRYRYLGCANAKPRAQRGACARVRVPAERLERGVLEAVRQRVRGIDAERLARDLRASLVTAPRVDVAVLEAKRRRLAARRDALFLSDDEFERGALPALKAEDDRLAREVERARATQSMSAEVEGKIAAAVTATKGLADAASDEDGDALRAQLRAFVATLKVGSAPRRAPVPVFLEVYLPEALAFTATGTPLPSDAPVGVNGWTEVIRLAV